MIQKTPAFRMFSRHRAISRLFAFLLDARKSPTLIARKTHSSSTAFHLHAPDSPSSKPVHASNNRRCRILSPSTFTAATNVTTDHSANAKKKISIMADREKTNRKLLKMLMATAASARAVSFRSSFPKTNTPATTSPPNNALAALQPKELSPRRLMLPARINFPSGGPSGLVSVVLVSMAFAGSTYFSSSNIRRLGFEIP
jgi:hypothetical protein